MARRDEFSAELQRLVQKDIELDFAVAQHIGIGRTAPFVLGEHVIDHARPIVGRKVDDVQRNIEFLGDQLRENTVVVPRAIALQRTGRIMPVDHEQTDHLVSLLLQQIGGHRRIDPARKSDNYACHHLSIFNNPSGKTSRNERCSKSMCAKNSSAAGTSTHRPSMSSSNSGLLSLS